MKTKNGEQKHLEQGQSPHQTQSTYDTESGIQTRTVHLISPLCHLCLPNPVELLQGKSCHR